MLTGRELGSKRMRQTDAYRNVRRWRKTKTYRDMLRQTVGVGRDGDRVRQAEYQPILGRGKKWWGRVNESSIFSLGGDTIPRDGQVKNYPYRPRTIFSVRRQICIHDPPRIIFFLLGGLVAPQTLLLSRGGRPLDPPSLISLNMSLVGRYFEVYTIFRLESSGRAYYFRI